MANVLLQAPNSLGRGERELIAAAFCMFNRYVDGLAAGTAADPASFRERARMVAEHGYAASLPHSATSIV